jgi:hypothetical protein
MLDDATWSQSIWTEPLKASAPADLEKQNNKVLPDYKEQRHELLHCTAIITQR